MNNSFKDLVKAEFEKVWKTDKKMVEYCMKKTSGIVQFEDGCFYCFEKPTIRTRFCFGYGQNGISTDEEFEDAVEARRNASTKEYFFAENLAIFDDLENMLNDDTTKLYSVGQYDGTVNLSGVKSDEEERIFGKIFGVIKSELTPVDRLMLKRELENQKKMFIKRLETYWKRYGASKFKTWTYLVD
jgi:hypothetical protein